jgi:type III secretion protein V
MVLAAAVGVVLSLLIIPMPAAILDGLLAANIVVAALILVSVLLSERPLALSSFPTVLVLTTLFRLGLNVSTTRMILAEGSAGEVVRAFGQFVARGDVAMGLVVFVVLTLVQLMVIGKGAERVAEVGARFTLDAMPGKQMSIDAALRNGAVTEEEAQEKRDELGRESQFYGAMDGAMKFVKGDAIVGIIVTVINLVVGLCIGVFRFEMTVAESAETFSLLTIGDGLVSQIPSLLIALSSGILTTRVASKAPEDDLGAVLQSELFGSAKALTIAAVFAAVLAVVPGLPTLPFLVLAVGLGVGAQRRQRPTDRNSQEEASLEEKLEQRKKTAQAQKAVSDQLAPTVHLFGLDLGAELSAALGFGQGVDEETDLLSTWIPHVRDACFVESGVRLPGVRVRSSVHGVPGNAVVLKVKDVPVAAHAVPTDKLLCLADSEQVKKFGVAEVEPAENPLDGSPACYIPSSLGELVAKCGLSVWDPAGTIGLHMLGVARRYRHEFIGLQETAESLKRLEKVYPEVVQELVPKVVSVSQLRDILRSLVKERVSIRDLKSILESLGEVGDRPLDLTQLVEHVRYGLKLQITHSLAGLSQRLGVLILEPAVEEVIRGSVCEGPSGFYLALEPELRRPFLTRLRATLQPILNAKVKCAILTRADIRFFVRELVATEFPDLPVVSYGELSDDLVIQPLGRLSIEAEAPSPRLAVAQ